MRTAYSTMSVVECRSSFSMVRARWVSTDPPAVVALEDGRQKIQKMMLTQFDGDEPAAKLNKLGFAQ